MNERQAKARAAELLKELRNIVVEQLIVAGKPGAEIIMIDDDYVIQLTITERKDEME